MIRTILSLLIVLNKLFYKNRYSLVFFNYSILFYSFVFLFKKYSYFLKRRRTFINNFLYLNVIKEKNSFYKKVNNFILDYKKKFPSINLDNRKLFSYLFFNNIKAKKLTKKLWLISWFNLRRKIEYFNNQLWYILLKSGLVISQIDILYLLNFNLIYLNFKNINNNTTVQSGDFISLVYNKFYIIYLFQRTKNISSFIKKFKKKYTNINPFFLKGFTNLKDFKKKKPKVIKFLFFFKNFRNDSMEIDYTILSIFVLNSYFEFSINFILWKRVISSYLFKLYNWKRIN